MNKIEEMKALVEKLNQYRDAYYKQKRKKWKKKQELF